MTQKSKHPKYDDPTAFTKRWPPVVEVTDGSLSSAMEMIAGNNRYYKMGKCKIVVTPGNDQRPWFMSIRKNNHYPSWDEIVWVRYNLIPDAVEMALMLPNLNSYINQENTEFRNVFTMQQIGWGIDPYPTCAECGKDLQLEPETKQFNQGLFRCTCGYEVCVNYETWNEEHSNGFHGDDQQYDKLKRHNT